MSTETWWVLVGVALLVGAAIGGWLTLRVARMRYDARLRRATEDLKKKHAAASEQLRAAQLRAQTELEQQRSSFKQQLAVVADEPRAAMLRAEERLKAAYAEIDRLRRGPAPDTAPSDLHDGFAATRPMRDGM
jgi:hypothetical protein